MRLDAALEAGMEAGMECIRVSHQTAMCDISAQPYHSTY